MKKTDFYPAIRFYSKRLEQIRGQRRAVQRRILWLRFKQLFAL